MRSSDICDMLKKLAEIELMVGGFLWLRLRAAVRRTDGVATTSWRRLENLSLLQWERIRV
ncbi:hypothetical protein Hanom_Chr05g00454581 [Helianthus anomalus]